LISPHFSAHGRASAAPTVDDLLASLKSQTQSGDHVVSMSNGGFENAPRRFVAALDGSSR
jgi:UDP-N-acetylmuramate: L-alanyl-gamma-D-glutamyl-meso-diaminopimelate ligase